MTRVALLLCFVLAACAKTPPAEPIIRTVEVKIPVPVACAKRPGPAPAYPDTDTALKAAADLFERVALVMAGRELRIAEEKTLRAGYEGCP